MSARERIEALPKMQNYRFKALESCPEFPFSLLFRSLNFLLSKNDDKVN